MPGSEATVPSCQGTTITFAGVQIGHLRTFDSTHEAAQLADVTNEYSTVLGSGSQTRVLKEYDATTVEPQQLTCSFYGLPAFVHEDCGLKGTLEFDSPEETFTLEAILMSYTHSGAAGEFATGTATFQTTGAPVGS